jgi:hypothetical protein
MTIRRLRRLIVLAQSICLGLVVAVLPFAAHGDQAGNAPALAGVLKSLRAVDSSYLIAWSADPRAPRNTSDSVSALKARILVLDPADREALLFWLQGHGRDALHQRGATDLEIGPPLYPIDYEIAWTRVPEGFINPTPIPTATPEPPPPPPAPKPAIPRGLFNFIAMLPLPIVSSGSMSSHSSSETHREGNTLVTTTHSSSSSVSARVDTRAVVGMLAQAASSEGSSAAEERPPGPAQPPKKRWVLLDFGRERIDRDTSGIDVNHGVAGIRNNAEAAACVSFANRNSRAVREIDFDLTFVDVHNHALQTMALRRSGSFEPNAEIAAPHDFDAEDVARQDANCMTMGHSNTAGPPISSLGRTSALAYAVRRVLFEDGTVWQRPGANVWPPTIKD